MPGMYNHCNQGYSSGTTVCAVERNNKKIEAKSEGILGAFAFCFNFFVIPLYRADGCSGTVSLIAVVIHAWHQEKET